MPRLIAFDKDATREQVEKWCREEIPGFVSATPTTIEID